MATTVRASIGALSLAVTGCTGNGVSPIVLTIGAGVPTSVGVGQRIVVASVGGNTIANGTKTVTAVDFALKTITFAGTGNGAYTSGGTVAREYTTIDAWEVATQGNLVSADEIRIGELHADADFTYGTAAALVIAGSTTDDTRYRYLRSWRNSTTGEDHRYNPVDRSGVRIIKELSAAFPTALEIDEEHFRLENVYVEHTDNAALSSGGPYRTIKVSCVSARFNGVVVNAAAIDSTTLSVEGISHLAGATTATDYLLLINCIVIGSNVDDLGAVSGFRSNRTYDRALNCIAYGCRGNGGSGIGRGFHFDGSNAHVRNCISMRSLFADFNVSGSGTFDHCISSDDTASGTASFTSVYAESVFLYVSYDDFRILPGSKALNRGADLSAQFTNDITSATRTAPWEIGAYNGYSNPVTASPTTVAESIGSGVGRDYATIDDWLDATALHLVARNEIRRGVLYADSTFTLTSSARLIGAVTDSRRYRELVTAASDRYDPVRGTGVVIEGSAPAAIVRIDEGYSRVEGVRVNRTDTGDATPRYCVQSNAIGTEVDSVFASIPDATTGVRACFQGSAADQRWRNCAAVGKSPTEGATVGFDVSGAGSKVQNCIADKIRRDASATGFTDGGAGGVTFTNCIGTRSDVCFDVLDGGQDHNASDDATAAGFGSITGIDSADVYVDRSANDYRMKAQSACIGIGAQLSSEFSRDIANTVRTGSWELGIYDGYLVPPQFPAPRTRVAHRKVSAFIVERRDGVSFLFAGSVEPLVHAGLLFEPAGGIAASARRKEASLREHNLEVRGIISSDRITFEDLANKKYRGARVTDLLIDWKYPFTKQEAKAVYYIRDTEFDGEQYTAQLAGISALLSRTVGFSYGPRCRYRLGSKLVDSRGRHGCGIDISLHTVYGVSVTSVGIDRIEFDADTVDLPGSYPDDDFAFGEVLWKTGLNAGLTSEVRVYEQSSRTITLFTETPYAIDAGDTFDIARGCDRLFNSGCDKFANRINFGGDPYTVGSDAAMETATA